jgi:peptide/nickel transport system substrate-binding protein
MFKQHLYRLSMLLAAIAILLAACSPATPIPDLPGAPTEAPEAEPTEAPEAEPTEAPEATEPPAATGAAGAAGCPAITVADMQGVAAGAWPQQYELAEFQELAGCELTLTGRDAFDERLVEFGFLPEGDLPPLEERLPAEPLVVVPYEEIGTYGGRITGASIAPEAGNSEWLSVRHVNLLRFADDLQTIVPNMAKSYEWNDDYTELTIVLRQGHKWSDGAPFTTEDIDFWWNDIILNEELYPTVPSFWVYGGEPMGVEAVDETTVVFSFAVPAPAFTTLIATTYTHLWAPKHYLMDFHADFNPNANDEAVAEGFESWTARFIPLYYAEWEDANHIYGLPKLEAWIKVDETAEHQLFAPNPYYYKVDTAGQQLPYMDEVEEVYAPENELIELKIINGEIHYKSQTLAIASLPLYQENQDAGNYDIQMTQGASNGSTYVFNCTHKDPVLAELFSDPRWNRAMSLALNREEINQAVCFGLCQPTAGVPVHRTVSFAEEEWFTRDIEYDPDAANALLDEIGLEKGADGFRLRPDGQPLLINMVYAIQFGDPARHELAKEYWEAVGVRVELREVSTEAQRAAASANELDIQITNSGLETEAPLYSNPFRLFPPFGDPTLEPLCGVPWKEWHDTDGASGVEPPDDIKTLWELTDQWKASLPGSEEYLSLGKQIVEIHLAHNYLIGVITSPPQPTIVSRDLMNVPQLSVNAFEYYRTYPYRTDQWFFSSAAAGN